MRNTDWDDLRYFLAVGERGSISGAAKSLRVNHSTVLRRLASFEKRLGVRLFAHSPAGYTMTAAGEDLRRELAGVKDRIEAAQRNLSGRDLGLTGTIRVTTTDTLLRSVVMPHLADFCGLNPGIRLDLAITNAFLALAKDEADVAIRPANTVPENLIGRPVGSLRTAAYASTAYLANAGNRRLVDFDWVASGRGLAHLAQSKWMKENIPEDRIVMRIDNLSAMVDAVRQGIGAGLLLTVLAEDERSLVKLAEPAGIADTKIWLLTHRDVRRVARIKALTEFLHARLSKNEKFLAIPRRTSG